MPRLTIAVIGAGDADAATRARAYSVGRLLAEHGCVVLTGGLGGVMEAASQGAREAGGLTLGLLPGNATGEANPHVEVAVATGLGDARNALIANTAQGFIAVSGSWGTLSEIAFALKRGKPVVSLDSFTEGLPVIRVETPEAAVAELLGAL
jgi:uncharacterized protein (TIGR00725 family)